MTEEEAQAILGSLRKGAEAIKEALSDVDDERSHRNPGPGRWSVQEVVEHIALTEDFLFSSITQAESHGSPLLNLEREGRIATRGADRSRRIESPEGVRPRNTFCDTRTAMQHFLASREKTLQYVAAHLSEDLRCKVTSHPLFGAVNVYEVLLLMAMHVLRHVSQIEKIKLNFS